MEWDGEKLRWNGREVDGAAVRGFRERYGRLRGRAWLDVVGPGWRVPIDEGYGATRALLREAFPNRPFDSDWRDGRFPPSPLGLPPDLVFAFGGALAALAIGVAVAVGGALAGLAVLVGAVWPLARLRDSVAVRRAGLRVGPPWAPLVPWHEVQALGVSLSGRRARVWARTRRGGGAATVPAQLVPALRARAWRVGGIRLAEAPAGLDEQYDGWRAPAAGIPWGILAGTAVAIPIVEEPWAVIAAGLLAMAATALLGAAVEARATGWGAGAILWFTGAYGVVLAAVALGIGGWF